MAQTREQKQELIEHYEGGLAGTQHAFLMSFDGMSVAQATDLRAKVRQQGGSYEVVKNRLALRAIEGQRMGELKEHFQGPTAVAYSAEDPVALAMREQDVAPGYYTIPYCTDMKELQNPEMMDKYTKGPVAFVTVVPKGPPTMGKLLGLWFVFCLVISVFAAYLAGRTLGPGAEYLAAFRIAGTTAFLGYAAAEPIASIWKGQPWSNTMRHVLDGLIYALLTGGIFGSMWPSA